MARVGLEEEPKPEWMLLPSAMQPQTIEWSLAPGEVLEFDVMTGAVVVQRNDTSQTMHGTISEGTRLVVRARG